ncbi:hypothetical protein DFQ01_109135 [Paenibacillus cellulosilyticus]|uniref:Uncharacterized protein n=1 Tax=Paenibacillus cellulosilyticus TaxID=375489 RepID=A0A2V2YVL7_9BACL|nr:hypothetical protein [Paenibacillus cellulosilyticus]PWW02510.1 hypothetical protein DFQ01_109135 [Paenibacillus cellulosilyticus]QKS47210.1 hypothetical protein HUB94_22485 [Paenibacillus cellulosilyticus]
MNFASRDLKRNLSYDHEQMISAYAHEGLDRILKHNNVVIRARSLTLTFEQTEPTLDGYRLASGEELNWWACVSNEIPKDKCVLCSDGIFIWRVVGECSSEGYSISGIGYVKI